MVLGFPIGANLDTGNINLPLTLTLPTHRKTMYVFSAEISAETTLWHI